MWHEYQRVYTYVPLLVLWILLDSQCTYVPLLVLWISLDSQCTYVPLLVLWISLDSQCTYVPLLVLWILLDSRCHWCVWIGRTGGYHPRTRLAHCEGQAGDQVRKEVPLDDPGWRGKALCVCWKVGKKGSLRVRKNFYSFTNKLTPLVQSIHAKLTPYLHTHILNT